MSDRFDLEQQILQCWNVVDDLKIIETKIMEEPNFCTVDNVANVVSGLRHIYNLKFEQTFRTFEELIKARKLT